jgi:hypothetical protein
VRTKFRLQAPVDISESNIEGTYYWPDEDGHVETTNVRHKDLLIRHGYTVVGEVSIMPPAAQKGPIEVDELGRSQLAQALAERGLSFPDAATRPELVEVAEGWNNAHRRGRIQRAAPREDQPEPKPASASVQAASEGDEPAPPAPPAEAGVAGAVDFSVATYDELKGWLTARGVAFPPNQPKGKLKELCEQVYAEMKSKAKAA